MTKTRYPLKLKDEVYITRDGMETLFAKKKVYAIGYGSLLFADGWQKRGMRVETVPKDLKECTVHGYKRGPFGIHSGVHFYGAIPEDASNFNAVLNPIHTLRDWEGLMQTELIAGMFQNYNYRVVDVTKLLSGVKLPKNASVQMVANEPINEQRFEAMRAAPGYYSYVWRGVMEERSKTFKKEFLESGGYDYNTMAGLFTPKKEWMTQNVK